jgi:hypothetical protein
MESASSPVLLASLAVENPSLSDASA